MQTEVTVSDVAVDQVGTLLSNGVGNGANEINSVSYYSSGYDDAYAEALKKAVELARTKAEALAKASGRTLGYVVSIEEYSDSQYGRYVDGGVNLRKESVSMAAGAEEAAADMNVMPGEMEVSANIKIVFSMGEYGFCESDSNSQGMDRKTVDIRDHALYNIGYDQVAVQYLSGRINYCSGGKSPQLKRRKTMAEKKNPVITIEMTNGDIIKAELYPDVAPNTVNNFLSLVNKGFYNGLIFHRVIKGFMIQGGCPDGNGMGGPGYCIKGEFSHNGFQNDLAHTEGVLSMARAMNPNSAGSQFFIMHKDAPYLNGEYAAFGQVIDGMDIVNKIAEVRTDYSDRPMKEQKIKSITAETFGVEYPEPEKC